MHRTRFDSRVLRVAILLSCIGWAPGCGPPRESAEPMEIAPVSPAEWQAVAPSPLPRFEAPAAVVEGRLFVFGGFVDPELNATNRVDVYDPEENRWMRRADMPIAVTHLNGVVDGHTIWFAGGFEGKHPGRAVRSVYRYDVESDTWARGPDLPEPRAGGGLVGVDRTLHYLGGFAEDRDTTPGEHWRLSLDDPDEWTLVGRMPEPRGHLGVVAVKQRIFVIGGQFRHDTDPDDVELAHVFDSRENTWNAIASLPTPRSHFEPGIFVRNGRIHVFGGRDNTTGRGALNDSLIYDIETDTWSPAGRLPAALLAPIAQPLRSRLIIATGSLDSWDAPQASAWVRRLDGIDPD